MTATTDQVALEAQQSAVATDILQGVTSALHHRFALLPIVTAAANVWIMFGCQLILRAHQRHGSAESAQHALEDMIELARRQFALATDHAPKREHRMEN